MYKAIIFIAKKTFTWDVIKTSKPFKFFWIIISIIKLDFLSKKDAFAEINISFLYKERFFATQAQCCLTFSWIKLQMLLRCCLIHIPIIVMRHILYLFYFCPCLGRSLFMSYLYDQFFIFSLIFIVINHTTSLKQTHLFFVHFLECCISIIFRW